MSFQPLLPMSGLVGWKLLQRTLPAQAAAHAKAPSIARDTEHFKQRIGEIHTAEALVSDRRLLRVALGAFGLQDDIDNRFFIRKILEEGTLKDGALSLRLSDDRYRKLSAAFGFGDFDTPRTQLSDFGDRIAAAFERQELEVAIGAQDNAMRLAMNAGRELETLADGSASDRTKWLRILGNPPLREVFETAFALPASFGQIDLDRQVAVFQDRLADMTGDASVAQFASEERRHQLIERYLLRDELRSFQGANVATGALTILQSVVELSFSLRSA